MANSPYNGFPARPVWDDEKGRLPTPREKLWLKCKQEPFVPIGAAATIGTLGYGVYAYRFRGTMTTSRYLMRLRVVSQGAIVLAMIIGAALTTSRRM